MKSMDFELELPYQEIKGFFQSDKFVGMGPTSRMGGEGLLIVSYFDVHAGVNEELALLPSNWKDAVRELTAKSGMSIKKRS